MVAEKRSVLLDGSAGSAPDPVNVPGSARRLGGSARLRLEQRMAFGMRQPPALRILFLAHHFVDRP